MSRIARYFFQGLIVSVPLVLTGYLFWAAFTTVDRWLALPYPGLGVLIVILSVVAIGAMASTFLLAPMFRWIERAAGRMPLAKIIYGALKDLLSAVVGEQRRFERPVLVDVGAGVSVIGFITRDDLEALGITGRVAVYLPQSYNFAGQTLIVPADRVEAIRASGAEAMRFIVSAGIAQAQDD